MFYALNWFLSLALLALWSLACWGMHVVTVWAVSSAGAERALACGADVMVLPLSASREHSLANGMRILIAEQLYRAVSMLGNHPYHR